MHDTLRQRIEAIVRELLEHEGAEGFSVGVADRANALLEDLKNWERGEGHAYTEADLIMPDDTKNRNWFRVRPMIGERIRLNNGDEYRVDDICHVAGPLEVAVRKIGATAANDSRVRAKTCPHCGCVDGHTEQCVRAPKDHPRGS